MKLELFLDQVADTNLRIFMGMAKNFDVSYHQQNNRARKPEKVAVEEVDGI